MKAEFANNLKNLRESNRIKQAELAARIGVDKSLISAYENQLRLPSLNILAKLSYQFNVSMEFLLGMTRNKTVDVSSLTPEQIAVVVSVIKEFEIANRK